MRFDVQNELSASQAFTGSATVSTNAYEKQTAAQKISIGRKMAVVVHFEAAGAGTTHTLDAIQADNAALTTNKEVLATRDITTANVVLGQPYALVIPEGSDTRRYLGFQHAASGGTTTATISAYLMPLDEQALTFQEFPKVIDAEV